MKYLILLSVFLNFMTMAHAFSVGTQNLYHYNTAFNERLTHLKIELETVGVPDIIGFQEAAQWTLRENLYGQFVTTTKYQGIYQNTNEYGVMNEGIALVSRTRSRNLTSLELPATKMFSRQFINSGFFETERGPIFVVNVHLSPFPENQWRRLEQVKFILQHIDKASNGFPVIVLGDLNDPYNSPTLQLLKNRGFEDVLKGEGFTYDPTTNPLVKDKRYGPSRLDYILYQPARLKVASAHLIFVKNWVSDHYGLRADFH